MCERGKTINSVVPIPTDLSHTGERRWATKAIDSCLVRLVEVLNAAGIYTISSCCGHGEGPGSILLEDGRELAIHAKARTRGGTMPQYGHFTDAAQTRPSYDPGLDIECPVCGKRLSPPLKTISLMLPGDERSYFYRTHKGCYDGLSEEGRTRVDGLLIDAIASARNVN